MKLHIDTENKTVAIEGQVKVANVFNYLMSWFPEDWEDWKFIPFTSTIQYKEIIVHKDVWRNPYWNPWQVTYGDTKSNGLLNPSYTTDTKTTINFNQL